jgi:hypothetical protein
MPQYWLKSLGSSGPESELTSWMPDRGLEGVELATGPVIREKPPQMTVGDRVLLHSPAHSRIVAEGEIAGAPSWRPDRPGGERWPWVYPCSIEVWVPLANEGPQTADVAPKAALARLESGGYAPLSRPEHEAILRELLAATTVRTV